MGNFEIDIATLKTKEDDFFCLIEICNFLIVNSIFDKLKLTLLNNFIMRRSKCKFDCYAYMYM